MRTILKVKEEPMRYLTIFAAVAALAAAACNSPANREAVAATKSEASVVSVPNKDGLIPGTPAGDEGDWVADIRKGISLIPAMVEKDPAAAQKKALELYVTRQEYSEMYYGANGRNKATAELATAITTAEERFHDLLKLLSAKPVVKADVKVAVKALDKQQRTVLQLWKASGAHITRSAK
ncbi:MAG TPA: hypothetical protein VM100_06365 [Longimicrobiales bacterium]|nr:hypothetical protein [Longimicrobiales bacterium]